MNDFYNWNGFLEFFWQIQKINNHKISMEKKNGQNEHQKSLNFATKL
jgi:hypothetical protein